MAKVVGNFTEGQKKSSVSERMHQRNESVRKETRQVAKLMQQLRAKVAKAPSRPQSPSAPKSSPLVKSGKDVPQTVQRPETQDQAARQQKMASKQFSKVKHDAQKLSKLQTKGPQASSRAATQKAVTHKGRTIQPDLQKTSQQQTASLANAANQAAQKQAAQQNAANTARYAAKTPKQGAKEGRPTDLPQQPQARQAAQASAKTGQPAPLKDAGLRAQFKKSDEGKKKAKSRKGSKSSKGAVRAGGSAARDKLGALMSGLGGGQDHDADEHEQAHEVAGLSRTSPAKEQPKAKPTFQAYNEFDTAKPGAEWGKARAQDLKKVTKERLVEIAQFDKEVDKFIKKGIRERVIGPLKHEIKLANFLYSSVYGGLIG